MSAAPLRRLAAENWQRTRSENSFTRRQPRARARNLHRSQAAIFERPILAGLSAAAHRSAHSVSPTARLLRNSKLFSLPPPLRRPFPGETSTSGILTSNTATLPHPTHAAIETTQACLGRGDWGLKRPLPLQSTTLTSTPVIRVNAIDSIDHITDFESAADHVLTLRKWQEMNVPITLRKLAVTPTTRIKHRVSVFEDFVDPKEMPDKPHSPQNTNSGRWKFDGPWLAGQKHGEFQQYVQEVRQRKKDFMTFITKRLNERKDAELRRQSTAEGTQIVKKTRRQARRLEVEEARKEILRLRKQPRELYALIWEYLDLPGTFPFDGQSVETSLATATDIDKGPPTTHPSAGLSYLRTASIVPNHPLLGAMATSKPIEARMLRRNQLSGPRQSETLVGVGGVVANTNMDTPFKGEAAQALERLEDEGGHRLYVHPYFASIDSQGCIILSIDQASHQSQTPWGCKPLQKAKAPEDLDPKVQALDRNMPELEVRRAQTITPFEPQNLESKTIQAFMNDFT